VLPIVNRLVANQLKHSDYEVLDDAILSAYNGLITKIAIADNQLAAEDVNVDTSAYDGLLEKIIAPYRGNVLFLDFWGIGCGPCRAGMIGQKDTLDELADKPFRALYIANADEGKDACEKWMAKENIKGEHIFVSGDDWNRLQALFNFSAIPFGAFVDKNGKVVKTKMHGFDRIFLDKLLSE
ncbi:MAG: redoxin family protein, partial [Duncaniella sp.]|nr:redoxin family protein [Duncaniella sp.]